MSTKFNKGALVWVRHSTEAWRPATVGEVLSKGKMKVFYGDGKEEMVKITASNPLLRTIPCEGDIELSGGGGGKVGGNESEQFSDDLTKMTQLITPAVLHSLHKSYGNERFYSKLGSGTVLALNPFKEVFGLFTLKAIQSYHSVSLSELQDLPAHVYATAQSALVTLRASVGKVNQSIIVSGESGAGKTWTVRCLMRYLAEVGIEYKRRLSSTDLSSTPLKGFHHHQHHVTPIRASMKSTIYEVNHSHTGAIETQNSLACERNLASDISNDVSMVTDRKHSSSFEEISNNSSNINVNNNNDEKGEFGSQTTEGDGVKNCNMGEDVNMRKILDFGAEDCFDEINEELIGNAEVDDILTDMDETVDDLNTSIKIVDRIERRILYSNPILEAFGNAHTLRNENSSRFGKYIQLQYDRSGTIVGAQLRTYLLEKTRAVRHDPGERSYHIFYQMLHGATSVERNNWKLSENPFPEDSLQETNPEFPTKQNSDFFETRSSMLRIGISNETQEQIFKLLSAVLHLRQLTFFGTDDLQNPCLLDEENLLNESSLQTFAELLGVSDDMIMKVITLREITAHSNRRRSIFHRPSTVEECDSRRDSLAKLIYEILFHWIVERVGDSVCAPRDTWCSFIGLLDVYGFESFENNSLEQLCINYANEKLQQHFVSSFLREQQEEYMLEGVSWTQCDLTDNVECLLALEAPRNSLFSLLNEECRLNRARAGGQLKSRVETMFVKSKYIVQPRISTEAPSFSVVHYAGSVSYKTADLIEKNKDEVPREIMQLLLSSSNKFVFDLVNEGQTEDGASEVTTTTSSAQGDSIAPNKGKHQPTVLTRFKKSLDDLLDTLASTDCHYIRCIKPNERSIPDVFDAKFVLGQLEACGVVETIRVCAPAHPNKLSYNEFLGRYSFLLRRDDESEEEERNAKDEPSRKKRRRSMTNIDLRKEACERIMRRIKMNTSSLKISEDDKQPLQYGKTMVFLSSTLFETLESSRSKEIVKCTTAVQQAWRSYVHRKKCRAERKIKMNERKNAASMLQRTWRYAINVRKCRAERKQLITQRHDCASRLQRCWTTYRSKSLARRERKSLIIKRFEAAVSIQSVFRGWRIRCKYKDLLDAWKQLKLLPEQQYRGMVEKRLRLLFGREPLLSPSPSYEAIRATFEMPKIITEGVNTRPPSSDSGFSNASCVNDNNNEKLTVYYDEISSKKIEVKDNVIQDDLEPYENDLHAILHSSGLQKSPSRDINRSSRTNSPMHESNHSSGTNSPMHVRTHAPSGTSPMHGKNRSSITSSPMRSTISPEASQSPIYDSRATKSPMHDHHQQTMTAWKSEQDIFMERPLRSSGAIRHAKIVQSCTNLDKAETFNESHRSVSMPKILKGPGVIYAWHNRAVIIMMTSKRPMSLSSDPMTLIEMQYNESSSVLTTPFSDIRIPKRSHGHRRRTKHHHGNRHGRLSSPSSPVHQYYMSPPKLPKSGSNCILKYADVPPKSTIKD